MMLEEIDIGQLVIQLHDIARQLENNKTHWVFGKDLRDLADRLARVHKNYCLGGLLSEDEQLAYDYARAISGMSLSEIR
jgi:hypothetical protein